MEFLTLIFLFGIGPLALLLGADSREDDRRGWWPAVPRRPGRTGEALEDSSAATATGNRRPPRSRIC